MKSYVTSVEDQRRGGVQRLRLDSFISAFSEGFLGVLLVALIPSLIFCGSTPYIQIYTTIF